MNTHAKLRNKSTPDRLDVTSRNYSDPPWRTLNIATGRELPLTYFRNRPTTRHEKVHLHATQTHKYSRSHNIHPTLHEPIPNCSTPDRVADASRTHNISVKNKNNEGQGQNIFTSSGNAQHRPLQVCNCDVAAYRYYRSSGGWGCNQDVGASEQHTGTSSERASSGRAMLRSESTAHSQGFGVHRDGVEARKRRAGIGTRRPPTGSTSERENCGLANEGTRERLTLNRWSGALGLMLDIASAVQLLHLAGVQLLAVSVGVGYSPT